MRLKLDDLILGGPEDGQSLVETVTEELVTMRMNFEICHKLIEKLVVASERPRQGT